MVVSRAGRWAQRSHVAHFRMWQSAASGSGPDLAGAGGDACRALWRGALPEMGVGAVRWTPGAASRYNWADFFGLRGNPDKYNGAGRCLFGRPFPLKPG
jgi:hypothetical protein